MENVGMVTNNYVHTYSHASWDLGYNIQPHRIIYNISFPNKVYCRNVTRAKQGLSLVTTNTDDL